MLEKPDLIGMASDIVSAYVANNSVPSSDIPDLIRRVFATLEEVANGKPNRILVAAEPAVPIRKSVTDDYIICLEDGKKFKSLKRHLRSRYNMSPEEYREKWGLPHDYPMVAPNYAEARSRLAKKMRLGHGAGPARRAAR